MVLRPLQAASGDWRRQRAQRPPVAPACSYQHLSWSFLPQSQRFRARGRTARPHQLQSLLGTEATVMRTRVVAVSHGWSSWETACTTSLMGSH